MFCTYFNQTVFSLFTALQPITLFFHMHQVSQLGSQLVCVRPSRQLLWFRFHYSYVAHVSSSYYSYCMGALAYTNGNHGELSVSAVLHSPFHQSYTSRSKSTHHHTRAEQYSASTCIQLRIVTNVSQLHNYTGKILLRLAVLKLIYSTPCSGQRYKQTPEVYSVTFFSLGPSATQLHDAYMSMSSDRDSKDQGLMARKH